VQGCLPLLNGKLPEEYQDASAMTTLDDAEAEASDEENEVQSG
jgi:hypothetical protein